MSEKNTRSPEADTRTVIDLYQQAADYLETAIHLGKVKKEPALYQHAAMLAVSAEVPELNGKKLLLKYNRPATDHDPTEVDTSIPLMWADESGRSHWYTTIEVKVYGPDDYRQHDFSKDSLMHRYFIEYDGDPNWVRITDEVAQPDQNRFDDARDYITQLDARETIAQVEWGLENLSSQQ